MAAPRRVAREQLVSTLLELAGNWFVLAPALELENAAERVSPSRDGEEWARRIVATIERVRDGDRDRGSHMRGGSSQPRGTANGAEEDGLHGAALGGTAAAAYRTPADVTTTGAARAT